MSAEKCIGDWRLGRTLGSGTTSKVKLAERISAPECAAVKIIKKSQFDSRPDLQRKIHREVALMKLLDHPHLLKLLDCCESPRHIYMFLELAGRGELFDYLVARRKLPREEALSFFREIIYGLEYLHEHGICHRDLKPENILLDAMYHIKIADFGFARWMRSNVADTSCGSPHYAAPEVVRGLPYDGRKADVWSAGVILFALLAGRLPFDDPSIRVLLSKVKSGKFVMPAFDSDIVDLISGMLKVDVDQRFTIGQVKAHFAFLCECPDGYYLPEPIRLIAWTEPIEFDPEATDASFVNLLLSIGYSSLEEISEELSATVHTPAKTFYRMWSRTTNVESLPWPDTDSVPKVEWDFLMSPLPFVQGSEYGAGFGRTRRPPPIGSIQSPDTPMGSIPMHPAWMPADAPLVNPFDPEVIPDIPFSLMDLMWGIENFLMNEAIPFFHFTDLDFIARVQPPSGIDPGLTVAIKAEFVQVDRINLCVQGITGTEALFQPFVDGLRQVIDQIAAACVRQ
jgi:BR serine/threonine kinase